MDSALTDADRARLSDLAETPDHTKVDRPSYGSKPDPDEPWRYACPECDSVGVEQLIGGERPRGASYTAGAVGKQQAAADRKKRFRCTVCGERKATLYDRKREREVTQVE